MIKRRVANVILNVSAAAIFLLLNGAAGELCSCETMVTAFGKLFPDNRVEDIQKVLDRLTPLEAPRAMNASGSPLAILTTEGAKREVVAMKLDTGEKLWRSSMSPHSRITVGKNIAVFLYGDTLVALSLSNGKQLWDWDVEQGWDYYGAAADDHAVYAVIGVGNPDEAGGYRNGRMVALRAEDGAKLWEHQTNSGLLGHPSAAHGMVFVPWDHQTMSVLDSSDGSEICRLRIGDDMIKFVEATDAGVYYGGSNLYRMTHQSVAGVKGKSTVFVPSFESLPGTPLFGLDAFTKPEGGRSAIEKIRYLWSPNPAGSGDSVSVSQGIFYLLSWRFVIAFDLGSSAVRWTYKHEEDIEAASAIGSGLLLLGGNGKLVLVDANQGIVTWSADTGEKIAAAALDAAGFQPVAPAQAVPTNTREGLRRLVLDPDNRMLPIRQFAAMLLGRSPDPQATGDLLDIFKTPNLPKALRSQVVEALKLRLSGSEFLVEALKMHYDFLEETEGPPMTVVAPSLVAQGEKSAIPDLLGHLVNHETSVEDVMATAVALVQLGDPSIVGTFREFLIRYHADSSFLQHPEVLRTLAAGLQLHGDTTDRNLLTRLADDMQTLPKLKEYLLLALQTPQDQVLKLAVEGPPKPGEKPAEPKKEASKVEVAAPAAPAEILPDRLTDNQVQQIITQHQSELRPCVESLLRASPHIRSIRLLFQITGEGKGQNVAVLPDQPELKVCIESRIAKIPFPRFRQQRMKATYLISVASGPAPMESYAPETPGYDPDAFQNPGETPEGQAQPAPPPPNQPTTGTAGWGNPPEKKK